MSALSTREIDILLSVSDGDASKQTAIRLGISEQTVKNHMTKILLKLGAWNRAHAVALAIRKGII